MDLGVPVDEATSLEWTGVAHGARLHNRVLQGVADPSTGSNFSRIDGLYPHERSSDWHRSYLVAALEHLLLWADLVAPLRFHPEQETIHTLRPAYTLGRASLEAASQAVWMSAGDSAAECARRHLSLIRWDYAEMRKSATGDEAKRAVRAMDERLIARVRGQFEESALAPPSHLAVLRSAAEVIDVDPDDLERVWRAASGAAHGRHWPSVALQHVVPLAEFEPGQFRAVSVPDPAGITEILTLADRMAAWGVLRHADYSGSDISALMGDARRWLASVVPFRGDADPTVIAYLSRPDDPAVP